MQTELQTSMILQMAVGADSTCDTDDPGQITSSPTHVAPQHPAKKQTRQWAAWTRQEEESFFSALRQVGKNFEKITSLVQSKNKNQVRHYYYRLVRRMNKLLGPGFCLDAKNSKETIAAMLRWWSLLEKYSCKASKLHLKPRRFKIFMDALEHQLLKDRKKNTRKRPAGENCYTAPSTVLNHSRLSGNDGRAAKDILVDSQNIPKSGPGKTPAPKHNVGANRISKRDSSTGKTTRQRRKPVGPVSSAAYKRWEKAAIAGVSLVADAAEHLERTATDNEVELGQVQTSLNPVADMPPLPTISPNPLAENNAQSSSIKLKLQLFPIDEATRKALEMDQHNPHLELTLSIRKKISSVLDHLTRKWGDSSVASGELMLFPYSAQRENLRASLRWAQDSLVSAADVYSLIGSPEIFRLRYGWLSMTELGSKTHEHEVPFGACHVSREHAVHLNARDEQAGDWSIPPPLTDNHDENLVSSLKDKTSVTEKSHPSQSSIVPDEIKYFGATCFNNRVISPDPATNITWHGTENQDGLRLNHGTAMSAKEWADSLTNISVGDLLSEPPDKMNVERSLCSQALSFTCDSFDAAIAAHISKNQDKTGLQPTLEPYTSLWDAEETCDAFSFQKNPVTRQEVRDTSRSPSSVPLEPIYRMNMINTGGVAHELPEVEGQNYGITREYLIKKCDSSPQALESAANDLDGLTDIYWPESLGPLDLDIPSSRYHCNDLILTDSLSSLKCLIATSLDAFQNSSFFGMEMKEPTSSVEPRETPICPNFKIGSGL